MRQAFITLLCWSLISTARVSAHAEPQSTADYAAAAYTEAVMKTLADLVAFPTVNQEGVPSAENPAFRSMTAYLERKASDWGLGFKDYGAVVVISLGSGDRRLGLVTHGDVQPADASKWPAGPFTLDGRTSPGRLIGRGSEDDKGPIAAALCALKAIKDRHVPLTRRVELIVSYTEESDWDPFTAFLRENPPPDLNVALDGEYPVVVAEKGWCGIRLFFPNQNATRGPGPALTAFSGGAFMSQVPEDAEAVVTAADAAVEKALKDRMAADGKVKYTVEPVGAGQDPVLRIRAAGFSAHSSKPEEGVNAITHLAAVLGARSWPVTAPAAVVQFINDLVGTGYYAEKFGTLAYRDAFMGALTLSLSYVRPEEGGIEVAVNLRRPVGKDGETFRKQLTAALEGWERSSGVSIEIRQMYIGDPYDARTAPHVPVLLEIFRQFTGQKDASPISIGGGSHARLVPNGVNFGPVQPGKPYTGHSEHEYIDQEDLILSLRMYTAMIERLAGE